MMMMMMLSCHSKIISAYSTICH